MVDAPLSAREGTSFSSTPLQVGSLAAVPPVDATELLRPGLLEGVALLVAGPPAPASPQGVAVARAFTELGAAVSTCVPDAEDEPAVDRAVAAALAEAGALHVLVVDGAGLFAACALRSCMDASWNVTRAVVNLAFLPAPAPAPVQRVQPVQRVLYLAPASEGEHAAAVRAALENLTRTLSVEWARHGITAVTIAPAVGTSVEEVAAVVAFLASPAGAYFSGCLLDMRG
jgi:NAD(P)-dependent dehydrogenase (short-subunit alcohol dehydrogenase family)